MLLVVMSFLLILTLYKREKLCLWLEIHRQHWEGITMKNAKNKRLKIVIVGGVAGGASAATRARRMNEDAEIVLLEKDGYISFANCGLPYYIGGEIQQREKLLVAKPETLRARYAIDVRVHHQAIKIDKDLKHVVVKDVKTGNCYEIDYDKLILSPGARPIVPSIAGIDAEHVYTLRNVEDTDKIKDFLNKNKPHVNHVTVVGAGFIGLEMIEQLHGLGLDVTLVELQDQVLPLLDADMAIMLEEEMTSRGIDVRTGDGVKQIKSCNGKVCGVELNSGMNIDTDMVLLGIGVAPNNELAAEVGIDIGERGGIKANTLHETSLNDVYAVGDVSEYIYGPNGDSMRVPLAGPANRAGRVAGTHAGMNENSPELEMSPVLGTSAVRLFGLSAAMTGMSLKQAKRTDKNVSSVTVTANDHVGYYPGASPIVLRIVYSKDSGRLLGAQAIGQKGVDKRIDVIATVMHMRGNVRDLIGLDLVYAPPFGAAKDIVHQAGFAAVNELDGLINVIQPSEIRNDMQVLDVRVSSECSRGMIKNAINIPLEELRSRLNELDTSKPTAVLCGSGLRSYIAARILMQKDFDCVYNVSGGMDSWIRLQKATKSFADSAAA